MHVHGKLSCVLPCESVFGGVPCCKISKVQKIDLPKMQRFHADPKLLENKQDFFKNMIDSLGFTQVLRLFSIIQDLPRFHNRMLRFYLKRSDIPIVAGPQKFEHNILKRL